jgi:hypothetical protein
MDVGGATWRRGDGRAVVAVRGTRHPDHPALLDHRLGGAAFA